MTNYSNNNKKFLGNRGIQFSTQKSGEILRNKNVSPICNWGGGEISINYPWRNPREKILSTILQILMLLMKSMGKALKEITKTVSHQIEPTCVCVSHSVMSDSCNPMDCSPLGSSIYGIFRKEYWQGLPFPSPHRANAGIEIMKRNKLQFKLNKLLKIKDRNGMELTEAKDLKKDGKNTQKNCTQKSFMTQIITIVWSLT